MPIVHTVLARVFVDDIQAALPVYQALSEDEPKRFRFRDIELAWVGSFLLLKAPPEQQHLYNRVATLLTADIELAVEHLTLAGGDILEGPAPGPYGARMIARHEDGSIFEYIETPDQGHRRT